MADSVLVAVVSGLAGAILGGFGQAAVARYAAFKEAQAAAASIRAEIVSLRELVCPDPEWCRHVDHPRVR